MKHATTITAGELEIGSEFEFASGTYSDGKYHRFTDVGIVTSLRTTKSGRVAFAINGRTSEWSHKPMAPTTLIQIL